MYAADDCLHRARDGIAFTAPSMFDFEYADKQLLLTLHYVDRARDMLDKLRPGSEAEKRATCNHNWLGGYCDSCGAVKPVAGEGGEA